MQHNVGVGTKLSSDGPFDGGGMLMGIYNYLISKGIIVRNRNHVVGCKGCLRITVGTPKQNKELLECLKSYTR